MPLGLFLSLAGGAVVPRLAGGDGKGRRPCRRIACCGIRGRAPEIAHKDDFVDATGHAAKTPGNRSDDLARRGPRTRGALRKCREAPSRRAQYNGITPRTQCERGRAPRGARPPHGQPLHPPVPMSGAGALRIRGARTHNLKNIDLDIPRAPCRHHRPVGLGQMLAGLRYDLCRGPAPLRRKPVGLCPAIPALMEKPMWTTSRGCQPGDLDRAEDHQPQSALHRRHGHRNLRLPAAALGAGRRALLPALGLPIGRRPSPRWSTASWRCRRAPALLLAPAVRGRKGEYRRSWPNSSSRGSSG